MGGGGGEKKGEGVRWGAAKIKMSRKTKPVPGLNDDWLKPKGSRTVR